jgi:hypothetical protein
VDATPPRDLAKLLAVADALERAEAVDHDAE